MHHQERTAGVLQAMRGGESLQCTHVRGGVEWCLRPSGRPVSNATANLVIGDPRVIAGRDGLFPGFAQTWRLAE
jgi:hypothetical protein